MAAPSCQRARRRRNLWRANPHCHWCNVLTVLIEGPPAKGHPSPDDMATLDHLRSRYDEERQPGRPWPHGSNTVLACWRCNNRRAAEENTAMPVEELHRRSGRAPQGNLVWCLTSVSRLSTLPALP